MQLSKLSFFALLRIRNFPLFLWLLFALPSSIQAQENPDSISKELILPHFDTSTTIFQRISQDSFFEVILQTNFDSLIKNKKISTKSYKGSILFKNAKGENIKMKVKVEPRGRSRRRVCSMPPLKIDFPKKELEKLGLFPGCDKLKLVTNCNDTENSDQVLMKEYWTYLLYNKLTPESFKVFSVKITYVNEKNTEDRIERYGFFIENNDEIALRLNGEVVSMFGTPTENINENSYYNNLMFQYMIGNLDWDIKVNRNVKLIKPKNKEKFILVPYDFDYAGLVKAPHARLNPDFNQKNIEERFPQGEFADKASLSKKAEEFLSLEKIAFRCYRNCSVLSKSTKKKMKRYLNTFFDVLEDRPQLYELFLAEE